jgi:hypothetical protein
LKAAQRWFERESPHCEKYNPVYLGDDLYAKYDICAMILQKDGNFSFEVNPDAIPMACC